MQREPAPLTAAETRRAVREAHSGAETALDSHLVSAEPTPTAVATADGSSLVPARTVGVQTLYRDGEAQTDPFSAPYTVSASAKQEPEVLAIAHLRFGAPEGSALPASDAEVALIQRLRARKELEAALPPMTDEVGFATRKALMQQKELEDWRFREAELDGANDGRVGTVAEALEERERRREFQSDARVESLRRQLTEEKDAALATINKKRQQTLRKLAREREAAERKADAVAGTSVTAVAQTAGIGNASAASTTATATATATKSVTRRATKRSGRDIVADYTDTGSRVFAPRRRDGAQADRLATGARFSIDQASVSVRGAAALNALDTVLPRGALTTTIKRPEPGDVTGATATGGQKRAGVTSTAPGPAARKADAALAAELERVQDLLRSTRVGDTGPKAAALAALTGSLLVPSGAIAGAAGATATATAGAAGGPSAAGTAAPGAGGGSAAPGQLMASAAPSSANVTAAAVKGALGRSSVDPLRVPAWRCAKATSVRPSTPNFSAEDETAAEAELEQAVLLVQRLLRGRTVQNQLTDGKSRRMALIREIRLDLLRQAERRRVEEEEESADAARRLQRDEDATLARLAGDAGSATLDFLAKELVRTEQKRRIARIAGRAATERRRREAEEGGRRQAEESVRAKQAMVWRQLGRVHEAGAASLVRETIDEAMADMAAELATSGAAADAASAADVAADVVRAAADAASTEQSSADAAAEESRFEEAARGALQDAGVSPRPESATQRQAAE
ncbi:CFAP91 [Symbiodinium sp. KB8]|nr:CFAP91 [Symbiodinium sp. KB8]